MIQCFGRLIKIRRQKIHLPEVLNIQVKKIFKNEIFLDEILSKNKSIELHRKKMIFFLKGQLPFCIIPLKYRKNEQKSNFFISFLCTFRTSST